MKALLVLRLQKLLAAISSNSTPHYHLHDYKSHHENIHFWHHLNSSSPNARHSIASCGFHGDESSSLATSWRFIIIVAWDVKFTPRQSPSIWSNFTTLACLIKYPFNCSTGKAPRNLRIDIWRSQQRHNAHEHEKKDTRTSDKFAFCVPLFCACVEEIYDGLEKRRTKWQWQ